MAALVWDAVGQHLYETGVDHGVLFVYDSSESAYNHGVAWNGLTAVTESPSGAELTALYADNIKYLNLMSAEEFGGTIEAYTYPDEFMECDGSVEPTTGVIFGQQKRSMFGFSYRTRIGNDTDADDYGYKIHLVYGAMASPSERAYNTVNDSPEAITFSWEFSTTPVSAGEEYRPVSHIVIDSTKFTTTSTKAKLTAFLTTLYGGENTESTLPLPAAVITALSE